MPVAGLDIHKRVVEAVVIDEAGAVQHRERFTCTRVELERFARERLGPTCRVALEATSNTWPIVGILEPLVADVVVSNPLRTRAIAEAKVKTDRVDALVLAQLLRADYLPTVWKPEAQTQSVRRLCTRRASLVGDRTRIKNRIHAVLHQRLLAPPVDDLFSKAGLAWLRVLALDADGRKALDSELRLLADVDREIAMAAAELGVRGYQDARVKLLMTLPGVDVTVAQSLVSALGDIERFASPDKAAAYLGLVPSTRQSADHCYHGPITKQGRSHTRWLLVQAAQHLARHPGPLGVFFRRLAKKKNRNVAVVATARKLVTIAWHMLRNNEPYRYAQPRPTEAKLQRLRVAAGQRKKTGPTKGCPRPANYGSGVGTRAVPSLEQLLFAEGLPVPRPLRPGERTTVRRTRTAKYVASIHQPHRIPRKKANEDPKSK
jgi:transposase